jgi:hypothetical protein
MRRVRCTGPYTLQTWRRDPQQVGIICAVVCSMIIFAAGIVTGWSWGMRYAINLITSGM